MRIKENFNEKTSLFLVVLMVLNLVPVISADELRQGSFDLSATLGSGKGTICVELTSPAESITLSGVGLDVSLPSGFFFSGNQQPRSVVGKSSAVQETVPDTLRYIAPKRSRALKKHTAEASTLVPKNLSNRARLIT